MPNPLDPTRGELQDLMTAATAFAANLLEQHSTSLVADPDGADELAQAFAEDAPSRADFASLIETLEAGATKGFNELNPGFMGYVPVVGLPIGAVADFLGSSLNRYVGLWSTAPAIVQLEWDALRWLAAALGYPKTSGGTFTSGGSMANFTALVAARHAILGSNHAHGIVYATDQIHHSNSRALSLMGLPPGSLVHVPVDDGLRLDPDALERQVLADRAAGRTAFAVIANAGTTNTGAVDPIGPICEIAHRHGLWVHVDGAYGGLFGVTDHGRSVLAGMEEADSITVDPHKGMFLPAGTGCVLVRDEEALRVAHAGDAVYLADLHVGDKGPNYADLSLELTRPFRGLRIWVALKLYGWEPFVEALDACLRLARRLDAELRADPRFELPWRPELSIVTFRLAGRGDSANQRLLERINASGRLYLSSTTLTRGAEGSATWLRACLLSHRLTDATIDMAVSVIRSAADEA